MARMKDIEGDPVTGWSEWFSPVMTGYRFGCCDCGLVHDMEFAVYTATKSERDRHTVLEPTIDGGRVEFRIRRNNRSTALKRHYKSRKA